MILTTKWEDYYHSALSASDYCYLGIYNFAILQLETYLKIARLFLEDDDPVQAEAYINRASLLQNETKNEKLQIHYKVMN